MRQSYLESLGYTIIRFTDEEVLKSIDSVMVVLEEYIKKLE